MAKGFVYAVALAAFVTVAPAASAQEPAKAVGPGVFRQVLDNPRVRVLDVEIKPGTKTPVVSRPDHVIYMVTEGSVVLRPAGRTAFDMPLARGEALLLPAQSHALENDGPDAVRVIIVELKTPPPSASTGRSARGKGKAGAGRSAKGKGGKARPKARGSRKK